MAISTISASNGMKPNNELLDLPPSYYNLFESLPPPYSAVESGELNGHQTSCPPYDDTPNPDIDAENSFSDSMPIRQPLTSQRSDAVRIQMPRASRESAQNNSNPYDTNRRQNLNLNPPVQRVINSGANRSCTSSRILIRLVIIIAVLVCWIIFSRASQSNSSTYTDNYDDAYKSNYKADDDQYLGMKIFFKDSSYNLPTLSNLWTKNYTYTTRNSNEIFDTKQGEYTLT